MVVIYAGVHGYSSGEGGLYKSEDWGKSWNYIGLVNHQVCAVAVNSNNEVFTGDWWTMNYNVQTPGLYALYEGGDSLEMILESVQVTDIAIAENDDIYIAANYWNLVSYDNGYSFEVLSKPSQLIGATELEIASNGHIYGFGGNSVVKSIDPLITALPLIKQTGKDHLLKLYPNPSSKYLNILFEGKTSTGTIYVGITNSEGKKVFERKFVSEEKLQIDIGHLPVGLYFARVRTNKELLCRKFIKR